MPHAVRLALPFGLLLLLCACGGGTRSGLHSAGPAVQLLPAPASAPALPASMPALPADEQLNPLRMTAQVEAQQNGNTFNSTSANAVVAGNSVQLPSGANTISWAMYLFGGTPGEAIDSIAYSVSNLDPNEKVYCAISDYAAGHWSFLPVSNQTTASFTLPSGTPSPVQSPLGNTWILLATFGGDNVQLDSVGVTYPNRHSVTGQIIDFLGSGVPGVLVKSSFAGVQATTAADGSYTLAGVPDGTWPLFCTRDGWAFYSQPALVTVSGADATAADIIGDPHGSRFDNFDALPNDNYYGAPYFDLETQGLPESLSTADDPFDYYRFTVSTNGTYLLRFSNPDGDILGPGVQLEDDRYNFVNYSASILRGEVAVGFTVNSAPQTFQLMVEASGGGGKYTLSLESGLYSRVGMACIQGGSVYVGANPIGVTRTASGLTTEYLVNTYVSSIPAWIAFDASYPLGDITIAPQFDDYVVAPPSASMTVVAGTPVSAVFAVTPPAVNDSFEPNNSSGSAHPITLPYDSSSSPLQVDRLAGGDNYDYFSCTPAAGKGLFVAVTDPQIEPDQQLFSVSVYDNTFNLVGQPTVQSGAVVVVPTAATNGSIMYIGISCYDFRYAVRNYKLQAQAYDVVKFQVAARQGTDLLGQARFNIYDTNFNLLCQRFGDTITGLTAPLFVPPGLKLNVDCYRSGSSLDRQTQHYVVPASDSVLYFDTPDLGSDLLEPNNDHSKAVDLQAVPCTLAATLDDSTDTIDYYRVNKGDSRPFKITQTNPDGYPLTVDILDAAGAYITGRTTRSGEPIYFPNTGTDQFIAVSLYDHSHVSYSLDITNADAYTLSGHVQTAALVGLDGIINLDGSPDIISSYSSQGGSFDFGELVAPGTYTLTAYAGGYASPTATRQVTITNANVVVDWTDFAVAGLDNFEPNNDMANAGTMALAADYTSTIGSGSDYEDYYKIALPAGDRVRFTLTPSQSWMQPDLYIFENLTLNLISGQRRPDGRCVIDFTVPENATYYIYVVGTAAYTVRVDKLN